MTLKLVLLFNNLVKIQDKKNFKIYNGKFIEIVIFS